MNPDPREFYQNRIPDQFNRSLDLQQEQAANEIEAAATIARPISSQAESDLRDAVQLMRLWVAPSST